MTADGRPSQVPIAVVGLAAFMPGSTDLSGFWRNVLTGRDLMTDVPPSRWLVGDYHVPAAGGLRSRALRHPAQ
jgi:acyl transferase domain-containing protein